MFFYPIILAFSLLGILGVLWRHFSAVKNLPPEEIKMRLRQSRSIRDDMYDEIVVPAKSKFYSVYLPAFWKISERTVIRLRLLLMRMETRLKHFSDALRGRHVNLGNGSKTEYWQTLNGAKNGAADMHKSEEEHNEALPVKKDEEEKNNLPG